MKQPSKKMAGAEFPTLKQPCQECNSLALFELVAAIEAAKDYEVHNGAKYCPHNGVLVTYIRRNDNRFTATMVWGLREEEAVAAYNAAMEQYGTAPLERKQPKTKLN